ncbi:MAG: AAA family ATPase [Hyphomonas sp.]
MLNERVIYPPLATHSALRQQLTVGEERVLRLFNQQLPPEWEIYIQPHLNGLRPDFVLLNPNGGIAVFEVKDWNLNAMRYFIKKDEWGNPALWAEKDGKSFCIQKDNPITKVSQYKKEIFELYCPRLQARNGLAAITAGVIFPFAGAAEVSRLLSPFIRADNYPQYRPISGAEQVAQGDIDGVFPEGGRTNSIVMSEALAKDLRGWLVEPDFASTQRTPLVLDRNQRRLAENQDNTRYRRLRGPAGSGKSLVLAARAARLANEGKSILVATYNITLWHYLRDLIVRELDSPARIRNIQFANFHYWCKRTCYDIGWGERYDALWRRLSEAQSKKHEEEILEAILSVELPNLANEAVQHPEANKFDAILVDEAQDYLPLWWTVLRKSHKPDGEVLFVADATQDVYGTAKAWTDEVMTGAGFTGRWSQLSVSYRLPPKALDMARIFAQTFLPKDAVDLPEPEQGALELYPCHLRWVQCERNAADQVCLREVENLMRQTGTKGLANADITILASDLQSGAEVVKCIESRNVRVVNTFGENNRRQKMGFYMGDARIKATTMHSFKGWESRLLTIYVKEVTDPKSLALIYTGLTRLKRSQNGSWLTVVCSAPRLADFGKRFDEYVLG